MIFLLNFNFFSAVLILTIILPLFFTFILLFISSNFLHKLKKYTLYGTIFTFLFSLILWSNFNYLNGNIFQYTFFFSWFKNHNINYCIGIDGISLLFINLTTFLMPICILVGWNNFYYRLKLYLICMLIIEFFLINIFCALDLTLFYIYFESLLIPMFFLIGIWGSRERKIHASFQFFFFTLIGSVLMLIGIIYIYSKIKTTDLQIFLRTNFSLNEQIILWIFFFIPFAVKIPIMPVHIWLPEAHVEAPATGSILLAGILLKLGTYGIIRLILPVFSYGTFFFLPFIYTICIISIIYSALTTIRQIDLKKIIAYSSIVHMNFALLGLFTSNFQSIAGSIFIMLSHGLVSPGLFICVAILYDRYHTRILKYYGGLTNFMPIFSFFFLFLTLANLGLPGTSSFIGEFLVLIGIFQKNTIITFFGASSMVFGAIYAIWLYNRVMFGSINSNFYSYFCDLNKREIFLFLPLIFLIFFGGIYSKIYLNILNLNILNILEYNYIYNL